MLATIGVRQVAKFYKPSPPLMCVEPFNLVYAQSGETRSSNPNPFFMHMISQVLCQPGRAILKVPKELRQTLQMRETSRGSWRRL